MIKRSYISSIILCVLVASSGFAQTQSGSFFDHYQVELFLGIMITSLLVILGVIIVLVSLYVNALKKQLEKEQVASLEKTGSFSIFTWKSLNKTLTDAIPMEKEKDILLDHEYDGIRELDNHLPPWWKWMFYMTIVWSVFYMFYYVWGGDGPDQYDDYKHEMYVAELEKEAYLKNIAESIDETNVTLLADENSLEKGREIYVANCAACHLESGGGSVGPNLTDEYWTHGGGIKNVFTTVKYGVPEKGMISWKEQLTPVQMQQVSSYILSLVGSNPENGKEPEGELWMDESEHTLSIDSSEVVSNADEPIVVN